MFAFETWGLLRVEGLELFQFGLVCRVKVGYTLYILTLAYYVHNLFAALIVHEVA